MFVISSRRIHHPANDFILLFIQEIDFDFACFIVELSTVWCLDAEQYNPEGRRVKGVLPPTSESWKVALKTYQNIYIIYNNLFIFLSCFVRMIKIRLYLVV